ncbi:MAG: ubiquitin-like domain-containing protein, partial [Clostridia bacterium]|nr:ubiquitin-like domain-containing protein [Clostridia bacterium]
MGGTTRLAGLCFVGLLVLVLAGQAWAKKDVLLVVDGREKMVSTFVRDVAGLLQQEKVILEPGDQVRPEPG